jgi:ribose transport system permease protein
MAASAEPVPRGSDGGGLLEAARERSEQFPWVWSFVGAAAVWLAIGAIAGRGLGGTLTSALAISPFLVIAAIGQMYVITAGYGSIDLSLPYVLTLAGFVSVGVMNGGEGSVLMGFLAGIGAGLAVAVANVLAIELLSIPPIVATLAMGLMAQSAASVKAGRFGADVDPSLHDFTTAKLGPIPVLALCTVAFAVLAGWVLHRTTFGRSLQAIGQNRRAADLAGLRVKLTLAVPYLISGVLAAVAGVLLAAYATPSLDIGDPYLLNSIAVVVLGGTLIQGGRSNVPGIWGGALFLILLVTLLGVLDVNPATQSIVKGALIILVLILAGSRKAT